MYVKFTIRIIGRSQKHSFRSILGFALIITMMIATSGVISGFSAQIFGITQKAGESPSIFIQTKSSGNELSPKILNLINHTNIKHVLPIAQKEVTVTSSLTSFTATLTGVNISEFMKYYQENADIYAGRLPQSNTNSSECLAGKNLYYFLGSSEINISDSSIELNCQLQVVGLIQNIKEFQNTILLEITDYVKIFNLSIDQSNYKRIKITLKNGFFVKETISDLKVILDEYMSIVTIKPEQQTDIFTASLFFDIVSKLNLLFIVLFLIALIRIFHTISWFVRKYERDLLIMRAMGLSTIQTIFLVILLASLIGNLGFLMGIFFGFLIPSLLFTLLTVFYSGGFYAPEFSPVTLLTLFVFSNLISFIAALYPSIVISRKSPSTLALSTHGLER